MATREANRKSRSATPPPRKRRAIAAVTTRSITISQLPDDIICKILLRISDVKSLVRCNRVCKTWRNLILQPYFAKSQLSRGSLPLSLIFHHPSDGPTNPASFGILEIDDDLARLSRKNATVKFKSEIYIPDKYYRGPIIGACNGLVCFHLNNDIVVCNPILQGRHFVLPKHPKLAQAFTSVRFGFGFSPLSEDYKVLTCSVTYENQLYNMTLHIFTLGRDDVWRSIRGYNGQPCADFYEGDEFVFVNGALHWLGWSGMARIQLCYFDVENEELGNLSLPCHARASNLGVLDDFLCLSDFSPLSHVNVWVMKDYIQTGAWTLKWVVELPSLRELSRPVGLIKILRDGTLLMILDNKILVTCNPQVGVTQRTKYYGVRFWTAPVAHIPSFLCPPWLL